MEKKLYIQPRTELVRTETENLMITASPGVGGEYDPNLPIDAKAGLFDDEEDETWESPGKNLWEE